MDEIPYDHLVIALGNVTDFRGMPGLFEHAKPFKNLADAISLRNHLIRVFDEAANVLDPELRRELLTFVVAGGGFSGVEVCAELNDFVRKLARERRICQADELRVVLLHSGERILDRELPQSLGEYSQDILRQRGVDVRLQSRLATASPAAAILKGGERIPCRTLVSTVPSAPHPMVAALPLTQEKGKLKTDGNLRVLGSDHVWAVGDCALIPLPSGGFAPPTAQHATREAEVLGHNLMATLRGGTLKTFAFEGLGKLGSLGRRRAVAELFSKIRLSGMTAWFAWRTIYWMKLPGFGRKLKVGASWLLDLLLPAETVQLKTESGSALTQLHYEPGDVVFHEGDLGDAFYMILDGEVEVLTSKSPDPTVPVATLRSGEFFGEIAVLKHLPRSGTVRAKSAVTLLALRQQDFQSLMAHVPELRKSIEQVMDKRQNQNEVQSLPDADPGS
ncbi:MAG: FAD-dependent oxidoreductase [Planctomycetota bacterium]|nr:FAD-dependent oxidoreductase [Planctomycetota bacterium]